jgi:hypothetical protein
MVPHDTHGSFGITDMTDLVCKVWIRLLIWRIRVRIDLKTGQKLKIVVNG